MIRYYGTRLALAFASCLLLGAGLEFFARIATGNVFSTRFLIPDPGGALHSLSRSGWHWSPTFFRADQELGWVPIAHATAKGADLGWVQHSPIRGTYRSATVTTGEDGIRSNGSKLRYPEHPTILATGDSFTFGGRVSDHQTWPSTLAELLGVRVLNAGVSAYGLDQSVLRAQQLAPAYSPDLLVVSFINEDLRRAISATAQRATKPFFRVVKGRLELVGVSSGEPEFEADSFRRAMGYSHFTDWLMRRVAPRYWILGQVDSTGENELEIGCLLMGRLEELKRRLEIEVLVLLQKTHPKEKPGLGPDVLACAAAQGLATLNLFPQLKRLATTDAARYNRLFFNHMTPDGNRFVAESLAAEIRERGWLGSRI